LHEAQSCTVSSYKVVSFLSLYETIKLRRVKIIVWFHKQGPGERSLAQLDGRPGSPYLLMFGWWRYFPEKEEVEREG